MHHHGKTLRARRGRFFDVDGFPNNGPNGGPLRQYSQECVGAPAALNGGVEPIYYLPSDTLLVTRTGLDKTINEAESLSSAAELAIVAQTKFVCASPVIDADLDITPPGLGGTDPTDSSTLTLDNKRRSVGFFLEADMANITLVIAVKEISLNTGGRNILTGGWRDLGCLLYTSPSPRDRTRSRMPSSA